MEGLAEKNDIGKIHLFNTVLMQALTLLTNYPNTQDAMISMLTMEKYHHQSLLQSN